MVIREIRGRHRMSKTVKIARSERQSLTKSEMLKTSVKKLGPLARQIAGKPVEEAIVQMRFSKKKAARDVKRMLEYARDEAMVKRGMGLGAVQAAVEEGQEVQQQPKPKPMVVIDKKGKRRTISDTTSMYVDQAWVGRGTYGREPDYRARGRLNIMRPPYTSKSSPFTAFPLSASSSLPRCKISSSG